MSALRFEVEQTAWIAQNLPVVLVRMLEPQPFALGPSATLGGSLLSQVIEIPPSVRADGSPRVNLFAFALVDAEELDRFAAGDVVELLTEGA